MTKSDAQHDDDDELGLDESLSSMRSMFREMRDEEPSDKGMAALLSAAREKAEEMKPKRSWLAVLLDQLRRPPVLAMATVVVLIGGAVVISKRDMRTDVEMADGQAPTANTTVADKGTAAPTPPPSNEVVGGAPGGTLDNMNERDRVVEQSAAGSAATPAPPPVVTQRPHKSSTTTKGPRVEEGKKLEPDSLSFSTEAPPADPAPAKKDDAKAPMAIATGDGDEEDMSPKGGVAAPEATASAPQADHKQVTRKPLPSIEGEDRTAKDSSVAQLLKQCEAAAAKNDCAAVRTIASKIAKQDPQTYKNRVMKNSKIAQCLEPPAPLEAAPTPAD